MDTVRPASSVTVTVRPASSVTVKADTVGAVGFAMDAQDFDRGGLGGVGFNVDFPANNVACHGGVSSLGFGVVGGMIIIRQRLTLRP